MFACSNIKANMDEGVEGQRVATPKKTTKQDRRVW
jgi:hypothetical protein